MQAPYPTVPYILMVWLGIQHRDNFTSCHLLCNAIWNLQTHTSAVYETLTIQLGPQIISVEKLECFDGLEIIYMFLGHLRYLKQPQLILIVDQSTALSNMKHHQLEGLPEQHKTSPITVPP